MLRIAFIAGSMGLLLGSATPPALLPFEPQADAAILAAQLSQPATPSAVEPVQVPEEAAPKPAPVLEPPAAELAPVPEPSSDVRIVVSLPLQKAYIFEDGELLWSAPVSTGKRGHETPTGTFPILQKKVHHRSSKYDNAPMPYMQRLTWYGIALHAGRVPGYPASHGCIRLPKSYAKKLYALTDFGTTVTITREKPADPEDALELA